MLISSVILNFLKFFETFGGVNKNLKEKNFFERDYSKTILKRIKLILIDEGIKALIDFLVNFELLGKENLPVLLLFDDISEYSY